MKKTLLFIFLLINIHSFGQIGDVIDKIVAVVGDETILYSDIENQSLQFNQGKRPTDEIRCEVLEQQLFQKLLLNQGKIDSVEVSDMEVQSRIDQRLAYFIQMLGSEEAFVEYYGKSIAEWREEFKELVHEQLLANRAKQEITADVSVTPGEVQTLFNEIPEDSLPLIGEQVHFRKLLIKTEVKPEQKLATYNFMDSIRTLLMNGKSSMTLEAAKWSEDPGSKFKGGCYPLQKKGSFVSEYEAAVDLTAEGNYSEIFETVYGYHFVYVKEKRGNMYEACHLLMSAKMSQQDVERTQNILDSLSNLINAREISFEEAVKKYSTDEASKEQGGRVINPMTGGTEHNIDELTDPKIFLALNSLEPNVASGPIEFIQEDGTSIWGIVTLERRIPAHIANLKDDYLIFQNQARAFKDQEVLNKWVNKSLSSTFVRIGDDYKDCNFNFDWRKSQTKEASNK